MNPCKHPLGGMTAEGELQPEVTHMKNERRFGLKQSNYKRIKVMESQLAERDKEIERLNAGWHRANVTILEQQAQIGELMNLIKHAQVSSGICCCGDSMENHSSGMICGHSPVDMWDNAVAGLVSKYEGDKA